MQKGIILSLILVVSTGIALGQVPRLINYQGVLINPSTSQPVPDNTYTIAFSIYDVAAGGSAIWTESQSVPTQNGLYSVLLGSTAPLTSTIFSGTEKYLGIKVGSDPEMTPRKRIVSVPYAYISESVAGTSNVFTSNGAVGIGTTNPFGQLAVYNDSAACYVHIRGEGSEYDYSGLVLEGPGNAHWSLMNKKGSPNRFSILEYDGGSNWWSRFTIVPGGNVGIGTTNPTHSLEVADLIYSSAGGFKFPDGSIQTTAAISAGGGNTLDQAYDQGGPGAGRTIIADAGAVNIDGAGGLTVTGKVGIGISNPAGNLSVIDDSSACFVQIRGAGDDKDYSGLVLEAADNKQWALIHKIDYPVPNSFHIIEYDGSNWRGRLSIVPGGNVGIGHWFTPEKLLHLKSEDDPTLKIQSDGTDEISGRVSLRQSDNTGYDIYYDGRADFEGLAFRNFVEGTTDSVSMFIKHNGYVGIGTTSPTNILTVQHNSNADPIADAWTTYSSKRWKTNIKPIGGALDKVNRLRGVSYDWTADGKHDIGLIAEEVGEVIPEVVAYEENGKDAKSIDYARLVAVLIEAMKEQQKQIEKQQAIIDALSNKNR